MKLPKLSVPNKRELFKGAGLPLLALVGVNVLLLAWFAGRTYPNTRVANYAIGSVGYSAIPHKLTSLPLLPRTVGLQGSAKVFGVPPVQLGVTVNTAAIQQAAHRRSWFPMANLWATHQVQPQFKVNQPALTKKLQSIAATDQAVPVDAQIAVQNNQFSLINAQDGYQLDTTKAARVVSTAVASGKTSIRLPFKTLVPKVTDASLEPQLQQLRAQQGVALTVSYNGNSTKVPAATIADWYADSNGQFQLQPGRIQAYLAQLGSSWGIHVKNLGDVTAQAQTALQKVAPATLTLVPVPNTPCSPNGLSQLVIVSLGQQHLWACGTYNLLYDAPVVTGMSNYAADVTPTGTFKVYSKQTGLFLTGSDSTGSWHEFVNYWMPFLTNQYGVYGFHDAPWRSPSDFGNISPSSNNASHGCVELPSAAAQWLYGWATRGTTVSIVN